MLTGVETPRLTRWLHFLFLPLAVSASRCAPAHKTFSPGTHQLSVTALHPSGQFSTNATHWFTNNAPHETISDVYDAGGYLRIRYWVNASGVTNRAQVLEWDNKGRLSKVLDWDNTVTGFHWAAYYDGLDRRVGTITGTITNGHILDYRHDSASFYDPEVEFLELGTRADTTATWKLYGPDLNETYGGLNGVGGLEAVALAFNQFNPVLSDAQGNVLGAVSNGVVSWTAARMTGYGAVPGHRPLPFGHGGDVVTSSAWRGRALDITGFYQIGARPYDPIAGRWLSHDPVWNGRDPNYYTFCGGDPINYFDPDGRLGIERELHDMYAEYVASHAMSFGYVNGEPTVSFQFHDFDRFMEDIVTGAVRGDYAQNANGGTAFGQTIGGLVPGWGQYSDLRDTSAAFGNMGNGGWRHWQSYVNLGAVGVAWAPGLDWVKSGRKLSHVPEVRGPHTPHTPSTPHGGGGTPSGGGTPHSTTPSGGNWWDKTHYKPTDFNGRRVYQRNDLFDPFARDAKGLTNIERMEKGRAPIGFDGESVNLHHTIQAEPGPIAEIGGRLHSENTDVLHGLTEPGRSFRYSPDGTTTEAEKAFRRWSYSYWQDRARGFK